MDTTCTNSLSIQLIAPPNSAPIYYSYIQYILVMAFPLPKLKRKRQKGVLRAELDDASDSPTHKCTGTLDGGTVMVQNPADVTSLLRLGFYGKGVFSRSAPSHVMRAYGRETVSSVAAAAAGDSEPERKRTRRAAAHATEEGGAEALERRLCLHAQWKEERERLSRSVKELKSSGGGAVCSWGDEKSDGGTATPTIPSPLPSAHTPSSTRSLDVNSDPYPVVEPLALIPEEALYLVAEVGRLCLFSPDRQDCYSAEKLWTLFCAQHRLFPSTYTAYRHYRRKGWVPKSGLKFGVHFLLYQEGPKSFHSSYAVLVREGVMEAASKSPWEGETEGVLQGVEGEMEGVLQGVYRETEGGLQGVEGKMEGALQRMGREMEGVLQGAEVETEGGLQELKWRDVVAHCRVCESAAKELVICHVSRPHDMAPGEGEVPPLHRVGEMEIFEVAVSRWIPNKER